MAQKDIEIQWLRTFLTVVHAGSMTAATHSLNRSQSAISMHIKKIEDVLGKKVFSRETRQVHLTPAGHELLRYADTILQIHAQAIQTISGPAQKGTVSFGIPDDYASCYLSSILKAFTQQYPWVEVTLFCEPSSSLVPKVESGKLDLAIVTQDHSSRGTFLFSEPLVWVGNPLMALKEKKPLPIAMYEFGSEARKEITRILETLPHGYRVMYNSSYIAGQIAAAESGLALAVLTRCSAPSRLIVPPHYSLPVLPTLNVAVIKSSLKGNNPNVDLLLNIIKHVFATS